MNAGTVTLEGLYYDGRRPIGMPATLVFLGGDATLVSAHISQRYTARQLLVSPRVGRVERFIALPDGGQLFILCLGGDDPVKANRLFAESQQAFDRWFKDKADSLLKANFDQPLPPITRTLFDWHA